MSADKEAVFHKYTQLIPFYYAPTLVHLKQLNLGKNKLTEQEVNLLINGISLSPSVNSLNLWGCELTDKQIEAISQVIPKSNIRELNLGNNQKISSGQGYLRQLESSEITSLDLSWNDLGSEGAKHLSSYLTKNKCLTFLDLSAVGLQDDDLAILISALQKNDTLTHLNLQNNPLTAKSHTLISNLLKSNKGLKFLSLRALNLGDDGVNVLSEGLSFNKSIRILDLKNNGIENHGFSTLLKAISKTNVEQLQLEWNKISDGEQALGIIPTTQLNSVLLKGNSIKSEKLIQLEKSVAAAVSEREKK